jgi:predicted O-methyltransferase YrrM
LSEEGLGPVFRFVPRRAYRAARALALKGRLDEAEQVYRRILKTAPDDAIAHHNLAVVLFAMGETYPAYEMLKGALQRDSFHAPFFATMTELLEHPQFRNYMNTPFYGPFNGQQLRQQIFVQLLETVRPLAIFETGTFRGTTTDFMARATTAHIFTCEVDANYFRFAAARFRDVPNVTVANLDSRSFLKRYVPLFARRDVACLCYLDAHWDKDDLPLLEELHILFEHVPRAVIMIDDFEVWDDPGYAFDDYGPAGRLSLPYLAPLTPYAPRYFFPIGSEHETGVRRGSVVLTIDPELAARVARIPQLRPAPGPPPALAREA